MTSPHDLVKQATVDSPSIKNEKALILITSQHFSDARHYLLA